jgi:hypothetical protein
MRSFQHISFNYLRKITAPTTASMRKEDFIVPSNTCLTQDDCNAARQQIGLTEFEIGNFSEHGCFRRGAVVYWGQPSTSLHFKDIHAPLDNINSNRIQCDHRRPRSSVSPWGVAWLMSFPNSGTSYTGELIRSTTATVTATNYGSENTVNETSVPLFDWSPVGPFLTDPKELLNGKLNLPKNGTYVLTKTHCGGYCFGCSPKQYVQTQAEFRNDCLTSDFLDAVGGKQKAMYDATIVDKAVHLVRDPFDNIVSRFHLKRNQRQKQGNATWLNSYPNTVAGFRDFCAFINTRLHMEEEMVAVLGKESKENVLVKYRMKIPCYSDFVRYVLWHNHAIETIAELKIESMVLHYEDYCNNHRETAEKLIQFVGLTAENKSSVFHGDERYYRGYFTRDEIQAVKELVRDIAIKENWLLLSHYFD